MQIQLKRIPPALLLFVLSPVLAELVSCYLPPAKFFHPLILLITLPPYGCGALIARELKVRCSCGWISLLWFGLAFGLFFEGIVTRILFNPDWPGLEDRAAYAHVFGFSWTYAVGIVHFQAVMAILCPILLAELAFPHRRAESWISARGLPADRSNTDCCNHTRCSSSNDLCTNASFTSASPRTLSTQIPTGMPTIDASDQGMIDRIAAA